MVLPLFRKKIIDISLDVGCGIESGVSFHQVSIDIEQELLKIPRDIIATDRRPSSYSSSVESTAGQNEGIHIVDTIPLAITLRVHGETNCLPHPLKKRMGGSTIDIDLGVKVTGELEIISGTDMLQSVQNIIIVFVGLVTELVAENCNTRDIVASGLRNGLHCSKVRCGRASQGCSVFQKDDFTLVLVKLDALASKRVQGEIMKIHTYFLCCTITPPCGRAYN
jgi:hypothetical protein